MITVYAGLWYMTGDIGYESEIILFAIMLIANLLFLLIWAKAYVANAEWAEKLVKYFRLEK